MSSKPRKRGGSTRINYPWRGSRNGRTDCARFIYPVIEFVYEDYALGTPSIRQSPETRKTSAASAAVVTTCSESEIAGHPSIGEAISSVPITATSGTTTPPATRRRVLTTINGTPISVTTENGASRISSGGVRTTNFSVTPI